MIDLWNRCVAAEAEVQRLKRELAEQEMRNEAQYAKFEGCPHKPINPIPGIGVLDLCGCSYDQIGDVCAHHAPALREAKAEVERLKVTLTDVIERKNRYDAECDRLEEQVRVLREALEAIVSRVALVSPYYEQARAALDASEFFTPKEEKDGQGTA